MPARLIIFALLLTLIAACGNEQKTSEESTEAQTEEVVPKNNTQTVPAPEYEGDIGNLYVSDDGNTRFRVLTPPADNPDAKRIRDESTSEEYVLIRARSASGVKYENADGYFFWTKGDDFMWGKGEETLVRGKLRK